MTDAHPERLMSQLEDEVEKAMRRLRTALFDDEATPEERRVNVIDIAKLFEKIDQQSAKVDALRAALATREQASHWREGAELAGHGQPMPDLPDRWRGRTTAQIAAFEMGFAFIHASEVAKEMTRRIERQAARADAAEGREVEANKRIENLLFDLNLIGAQLGISKRDEIEGAVTRTLATMQRQVDDANRQRAEAQQRIARLEQALNEKLPKLDRYERDIVTGILAEDPEGLYVRLADVLTTVLAALAASPTGTAQAKATQNSCRTRLHK